MTAQQFRRWLGATAMVLLAARSALAGATLSAGTVIGIPGSVVQVPISISITPDTNVVALNFDLLYDTNYVTPGTIERGPALADQGIGNGLRSPGDYIVLMYTFSYIPMSNGVIAYIPFTIATNAPDLDEGLVFTNYLLLADQQLDSVQPVSSTPGTVAIRVQPVFSAVYPTNQGRIHLELAGTSGRNYTIQAATNLEGSPQWTGLYTNTATNGVVKFDDPPPGGLLRRFYRAVLSQ